MKFRSLSVVFVTLFILLLSHGCGGITPVWKGEAKLDTLTLFFSEPVEFEIKFTHPEEELPTRLELSITYDPGINRERLPLYLTIEDNENHQVQEFDNSVTLKENGQWLGEKEENQVDYTLTYDAIDELTIKPSQTYEMKIFSNDEESEKIYGIIKVVARLYPIAKEG